MNITDVGHLTGDDDEGEDKMVKSAEERGKSVLEIADYYTKAFFHDTDRMNITRPTIVCKATDHIPEMIALIEQIEKNGFTYFAGGNLYFDISRFPSYGELAMLKLDELKTGTRVESDENKRNPQDFVLWFTKSKFENQALVWDSPWGRGYPGWHIECSAMSMKYLGNQFDIHAGGIDHISIHHTNEIAQSEAALAHLQSGNKPWVKYWLHNEFLVLHNKMSENEKMSKSAGSFITLQDLVNEGFHPLDYRYFLLGGHYRSQLRFSVSTSSGAISIESMKGARNSRKSLIEKVCSLANKIHTTEILTTEYTELHGGNNKSKTLCHSVPSVVNNSSVVTRYLQAFNKALEDDLNTPRALAELWGLLRDGPVTQETLLAVFDMDKVLALGLEEACLSDTGKQDNLNSENIDFSNKTTKNSINEDFRNEIEALITERTEAKKVKDYAAADSIRQNLKKRGIILEDGPNGTTWRKDSI
jgi:cysteinyl-tRNA synthetase